MTTIQGLRVVGLIAVLGNSEAWSEDPPVPAPPTRLARADTDKKAQVPSNTASLASPESQAPQGPTAATVQGHLARRAARLPGVSCDPNGPVYQVVGAGGLGSAALSGRTDLLVHFGAGGRPDEVRIERSSGDDDFDASLALAVCALGVPQGVQGGPVPAGWGRLSVRLTASD